MLNSTDEEELLLTLALALDEALVWVAISGTLDAKTVGRECSTEAEAEAEAEDLVSKKIVVSS